MSDTDEVNRIARLLMDAWKIAERRDVGVSYVATFADMARAVVEDRDKLLAEANAAADVVAADWAEMKSMKLRIASLTDALRGLVDRIERVGGYATTEDRLALWQAKQALAASR